MKTKLTQALGIELPIVQAAMSWASSTAELPAAVCNAGGLGVLAAGPLYVEDFERELKKLMAMTSRPYAINVPLNSKKCAAFLDIAHAHRVPIVIASQGGPKPHLPRFKAIGTHWIQVVSSLEHALKAQSAGVDALVVVGSEAGGHPPRDGMGTLVNVRHVLSKVSIPVIAAGGVADGWGIAALLALGADAVQLGTRFLMTHEANVHVNYKMAVKESELGQTVLVGDVYPVRVVKNSFTQQMQVLQDNPSTHAQAQQLFEQTSLKQAAFLGDVLWGKIEAGQSAGLIDEVLSVSELMGNLTHQMKHAFERMKNLSEGL